MIIRCGFAVYGLFVRSKQCQVNGRRGSNLESTLYIKFLMVEAKFT